MKAVGLLRAVKGFRKPSMQETRRTGVRGILRIAYKLLGERQGQVCCAACRCDFAVFLMTMMTSMFAGILKRSSSTVINIGATVWVMDPAVNTVAGSIPMPDYILDAVRSIDGVNMLSPFSPEGLS